MRQAKYMAPALLLLGVALAARASESLYDEKADAAGQVRDAIKAASEPGRSPRNVVLIFGANW